MHRDLLPFNSEVVRNCVESQIPINYTHRSDANQCPNWYFNSGIPNLCPSALSTQAGCRNVSRILPQIAAGTPIPRQTNAESGISLTRESVYYTTVSRVKEQNGMQD